MLDVITRGRIISGFVRGVGDEYVSFSMDPTTSRDRFLEAYDLIIRAWTEPGPFHFEGKHYNFRYVNPWPRPFQKPHPPIWMPSQGSQETIEFAAERKYPYMQVFSPFEVMKKILDSYKAQAADFGYEAGPEQLGWAVPIYVADTDERAWAEAERHLSYLFNKLLRRPATQFFPPGYLTERSMGRILAAKADKMAGDRRPRELDEKGVIIVGSAATVRDRLREYEKEAGFGLLVALLHFGSLPHDLTMKNLELFAAEVMPHFRVETPLAAAT